MRIKYTFKAPKAVPRGIGESYTESLRKEGYLAFNTPDEARKMLGIHHLDPALARKPVIALRDHFLWTRRTVWLRTPFRAAAPHICLTQKANGAFNLELFGTLNNERLVHVTAQTRWEYHPYSSDDQNRAFVIHKITTNRELGENQPNDIRPINKGPAIFHAATRIGETIADINRAEYSGRPDHARDRDMAGQIAQLALYIGGQIHRYPDVPDTLPEPGV